MKKFLMLLNGNKRIIALVMFALSAAIRRYPALEPILGGFSEADVAGFLDMFAIVLGSIGTAHAIKKTADAEAKTQD